MSSQSIDPRSEPSLHSLPNPGALAGLLGVAPVEPGFYGDFWSDTILLTTNHGPILAKLGQGLSSLSPLLLALDGGGFSPRAAVALDAVTRAQAETILTGSQQGPTRTGRLLVPACFAGKFNLTSKDSIGGWSVHVVPDDLRRLVASASVTEDLSGQVKAVTPGVIQRLLTGSHLFAGQALLLSIPMLVFGWKALVFGLGALLAATLILALAWKILPGRGWLKGLVAGGILGVGFALLLILVLEMNVLLAVGLFVAFFWMGIVFSGVKH